MHWGQVLVDGKVLGTLERNNPRNLSLALPLPPADSSAEPATLDILVHALGRVNFGCVKDTKGLQSPEVLFDGGHPILSAGFTSM